MDIRVKKSVLNEDMIDDVEMGVSLNVVDGELGRDDLDTLIDNMNNMHNLIIRLIGKCVENDIDINNEIAVWGPEYDGTHGIDIDSWND